MREELRLLNALIGMTLETSDWPTILRERGFALTALQGEITPTVDGRLRTVVPEAVFQSFEEHWLLLVESKSRTFEEDQAKRYLAIVPGDVVARGAALDDPEVAGLDVLYFAQAATSPALKEEIEWFNESNGHSLPLVDYDNQRFMKVCGEIGLAALDLLFDSGIYFREANWPTRFVPFDAESPQEEMQVPVLADLVAVLRDGDISSFDARDIAEMSVPFLAKMGSSQKRLLLGKVRAIIEEFRVAYLGNRLLDRTGSPPAWIKTESLLSTQASTIHSMQVDYIKRKRDGMALPRERQVERLVGEIDLEPDEGR